MDRLDYFDQMKGVAILFVVIGHVLLFSFGTKDSSVFQMLTIFHMPIFFYISGYLAYKQLPSIKELQNRIWKRTHVLIFPYIVFAGLWCFFKQKDFVLLILKGGDEYWFLFVLFILTVFFLLYEQIVKHIKNTWLYVVAWLVPYLILIVVQHKFAGFLGDGIFTVNNLVAYYRFYLLGYLCKKYETFNFFLFHNKWVYAIGFITFFAKWYWYDSMNMFVSMMGITGTIIILQNFFATIDNPRSLAMKCLLYIGQNSLEIYLLQYFFLPDISKIIQPYFIVPNGFIWQLCLAFILTIPIIAVCIFVGNLIKKNKILSWVMLGK